MASVASMVFSLAGFAAAATLLILAPGPDSMLVLRNTLRGGRRAGWVTASGTLTGLLAWAAAAALGLSALLQASRVGYEVLRFAGACYLVWLGVTSLGSFRRRAARRAGTVPAASRQASEQPPAAANGTQWRRLYLHGLVSNLLNPKIGVFFIAFLPGFIPAGSPAAVLSFTLGLWFVAETGAWLGALAWLAARGAGWLQRPRMQRRLERVTGLVLIGFGVRLATAAR